MRFDEAGVQSEKVLQEFGLQSNDWRLILLPPKAPNLIRFFVELSWTAGQGYHESAAFLDRLGQIFALQSV